MTGVESSLLDGAVASASIDLFQDQRGRQGINLMTEEWMRGSAMVKEAMACQLR